LFYLGGGKGFVGQRLGQLLREKGFQNIWIVSRKSDGKSNTLTWVMKLEIRITYE
jgi:NAD dependent epimerase/dehydratase family enzyme